MKKLQLQLKRMAILTLIGTGLMVGLMLQGCAMASGFGTMVQGAGQVLNGAGQDIRQMSDGYQQQTADRYYSNRPRIAR